MSSLSLIQPSTKSEAFFLPTVINEYHACSDQIIGRCSVPKSVLVASHFDHSTWLSIFHYLDVKDIYRFIGSAPVWKSYIDLDKVRCQFFVVKLGMDAKFFKIFEELCLSQRQALNLFLKVLHLQPALIEDQRLATIQPMSPYINLLRNDESMAQKVSMDAWDFSESGFGYHNIVRFLSLGAKVKEINMRGENLQGSWAGLKEHSLPAVKKMNMSNVMTESVPYILRAIPNVEELDLSDISNGYETIVPQGGVRPDLTKLKRLNLSGSTLCVSAIIEFLKAASNLEELNLNQYQTFDGIREEAFDGLDNLSFPKLRILNLKETMITKPGLLKLLKASPNLSILNMCSLFGGVNGNNDLISMDMRGFFDQFEPGYFSSLESINLQKNMISKSDLDQLHRIAPNLKIMELPETLLED